jgi:hypothetical protein
MLEAAPKHACKRCRHRDRLYDQAIQCAGAGGAVRAALRRYARSAEQPPVLQLGTITVDLTRRTARAAGGEHPLYAAGIPGAGLPPGPNDRDDPAAHPRSLGSPSARRYALSSGVLHESSPEDRAESLLASARRDGNRAWLSTQVERTVRSVHVRGARRPQ